MHDRQQNTPDYSYLVQAWAPGNKLVMTFRIDQKLPLPAGREQAQRVTNQVQADLSALSKRTGLAYELWYWGTRDRVNRYIVDNNVEVS